jgi:hypothetical protein
MKKIFALILVGLFLFGCVQQVQTPTPTPSAQATVAASPTQAASTPASVSAKPSSKPTVSPSTSIPFPSIQPPAPYCVVRAAETEFEGPKSLDVSAQFYNSNATNATIDCGNNQTDVNISAETQKAFRTCDYPVSTSEKHYLVVATSTDGAVCNKSITLVSTSPPEIKAVESSVLSSTSASIAWTTDRLSNGKVEYGIGGFGTVKEDNATYIQDHEFTIESLTSNSTYKYRVTSCDQNTLCTVSNEYSFQTPA